MKKIKVKYQNNVNRIEKIDIGDWIDLRCANEDGVELKAGQFGLIPLGVAMELPSGYEAYVVPRSSTFKNFGIIQTNSFGIIDESYCGDNDWWFMPVYATKDTFINFNDRVCQFRISKKMKNIEIEEVEFLNNKDRKGFGSTGIK